MNIFQGVKFNSMQFVAPLIILAVTMLATVFIFRLLFGWLPKKLFNFLLGPVALVGTYIWAIPMNMGFFELFK
jgi:hypothetical protein